MLAIGAASAEGKELAAAHTALPELAQSQQGATRCVQRCGQGTMAGSPVRKGCKELLSVKGVRVDKLDSAHKFLAYPSC